MNSIAVLDNTTLQFIISFLSILSLGFSNIKYIQGFRKTCPSSKKNTLKGLKNISNKLDEISNYNRFIQELEISSVPILKYFNWLEVKAIYQRDISIVTLQNLVILGRKQLIALDNNRIYLPNRWYVFLNHRKYSKSVLLVGAFIASLVWLIYILFTHPSTDWLFVKVLILTLLFEMWVIIDFEDVIIVNQLKGEKFIENNNIYISEDFIKAMIKYKEFQSNYYTIKRIEKLQLKGTENTNSEV